MTSLVLLAGSGTVGIIDAPCTVIAALFAVCRLWRYWAASRTYVAREAEARRQLHKPPRTRHRRVRLRQPPARPPADEAAAVPPVSNSEIVHDSHAELWIEP